MQARNDGHRPSLPLEMMISYDCPAYRVLSDAGQSPFFQNGLQFLQRSGKQIAEHEDLDGCDNYDGSLLEQTSTLPCKLRHMHRPTMSRMITAGWARR
jgi:hypothetical protein